MNKTNIRLSQIMEDYLETIFVLSKEKGYARTGEIARYQNVSPSSVVEMIGKLSKFGYVEWKRYEGVYLLPEGKMRGEVIHIRHETLRQFFEFIGVAHDIANKEACIIEHELSPITTSAIGNLVTFLKTPQGSQTLSSFELFLKISNTGLPPETFTGNSKIENKVDIMHPSVISQANQEILSVISRHDLLNTISALGRYLDLLKSIITGDDVKLVISRIESSIHSINRQVTNRPELLIQDQSEPGWMKINWLFISASNKLNPDLVIVEQNLENLEVYGDAFLERAISLLLENLITETKKYSSVITGYNSMNNSVIWFIQGNCQVSHDDEKKTDIQKITPDYSNSRLFPAYQIINACGMQISAYGTDNMLRYEITIPDGLYMNSSCSCSDF